MKKIPILICIFIISFSTLFISYSQENKPFIILYENGTWEKLDNKDKEVKSITEFWSDFKSAVLKNDKKIVLNYFKYPLPIIIRFGTNCKKPICKKLDGACSFDRLEKNYDVLFDNNLISNLKNSNPDEYFESRSNDYNRTEYRFEIKLGKDIIDESEYNMIIQFIITDIDGEYKIIKVIASY